MFCAFPKPLSQGSGLGLRVTSNDNLFVVICVQTTRDIQNSNAAFLKKGKSITKLNYLKQIFLSKDKEKYIKEKLALPAPPFNMQDSRPASCQQLVWCKYTYPEPSMVPELCDIAFRWQRHELTKVMLYTRKRGSQTSSEWFRDSQKWRSNEVVGIWKHTVLNISPWKYVYALVYWPASDTICYFIAKGYQGNSYGEVVPPL